MKFSIERVSDYFNNQKRAPVYAARPNPTGEKGEWIIEIETLEELLALVASEGNIIVGGDPKGGFSLEIYDDWIE